MSHRVFLVFLHDFLVSFLAFAGAFLLRVGFDGVWGYAPTIMQSGLIFSGIAAVLYRLIGTSRAVWRFTSISDFKLVVFAATAAIVVWFFVEFTFSRLEGIPRTLPFILWFILVFFLAGPRIMYRRYRERREGVRRSMDVARSGGTALVVGTDEEAVLASRSLEHAHGINVLGILDDKGSRKGRSISGYRVLGSIHEFDSVLDHVQKRTRVDRIVLSRAPQFFAQSTLRTLVDTCQRHSISVEVIPAFSALDSATDFHLRRVETEDFLGREEHPLLSDDVKMLIKGQRVLVTGAGGSIGSTLVKTVARFAPEKLILMDANEYNLYKVDQDCGIDFADVPRSLHLTNVRDRACVFSLFEREKPDLVLHAAALKHVPIVESNVSEAVKTNVFGTMNVADAAKEFGAQAFVLISTDKAVQPSSMMGATKLLAERYVLSLAQDDRNGDSDTRFVVVRFGNVIGSSGSVIPLFRRQIDMGGPVTVTHPEMTRYFMSIFEASLLVLRAAKGLVDGDIPSSSGLLVLDMGEPKRIVDLAREMITFAGKIPEKDISIQFIGLRAGEKLHETLFGDHEVSQQSHIEKIQIAHVGQDDINKHVDLIATLKSAQEDHIADLLVSLVTP